MTEKEKLKGMEHIIKNSLFGAYNPEYTHYPLTEEDIPSVPFNWLNYDKGRDAKPVLPWW